MAIPDYQTLMLPVLRLAAKGEQRVADVADRVAVEFGLSAEERGTLLPSGRQRVLNNRIHWAINADAEFILETLSRKPMAI